MKDEKNIAADTYNNTVYNNHKSTVNTKNFLNKSLSVYSDSLPQINVNSYDSLTQWKKESAIL